MINVFNTSQTGPLDHLQKRGLRAECTPLANIHLATSSRSIYCGFDPTAASLQLGNLIPIMALRHLQLCGHRPILVLGGATAQIGDPSGKSKERNIITLEEVKHNESCIRIQIEKLLDFDCGESSALLLNNADWIENLGVVDFLRGPGKLLSAKRMASLTSVKDRMERDSEGISIAEFIYSSLQAIDFAYLFERYGCTVQAGGQDQWGNIITGIDLIKRKAGADVHGITFPLITDSLGRKMGKTEAGTIWLSETKCTPFAMHQYFLHTADDEAINWLKLLTLRSLDEIDEVKHQHERNLGARIAQNLLGDLVVSYVHGAKCLSDIKKQTELLFNRDTSELSDEEIEWLSGLPDFARHVRSTDVVSLLVEIELAASKSEARRLLDQQSVTLGGVKLDASHDIGQAFAGKRCAVIKRGKQFVRVAVLT